MGVSDDSTEDESEHQGRRIFQHNRKRNKRAAIWRRQISAKRRRHRRRLSGESSDEESPSLSSRRNSHYVPQISPKGRKKPKLVLNSSNDNLKFLNNYRQCVLKSLNKPSPYEKLLLRCKQSRLNAKYLLSNNRSKKNPAVTNTPPTDLSNDLKSPRNLQTSARVVQETENLPDGIKSNHEQAEPNSADNSEASSTEESSSKPSYVFHNLFCANSDDKDEELQRNVKIFHSNLPMDVLTEEQFLLRDIKIAFRKAFKSMDSINQTKALNIPQTSNKDESQNLVDQDTEECFDWDKFIDRWEGERTISDSTLDTQHHEKVKADDEVCPPMNSASTDAEKCLSIAKSPEKTEKFKSSSLAEELETIIQPVAPDISEYSVEIENFIKNSKIEPLEDYETPSYLKNFLSTNSEDCSSRGNGFPLYGPKFNFVTLNLKNIIGVFKKSYVFHENVSGSANNSTDKIESSVSTPVRSGVEINDSVSNNAGKTKKFKK